MEVRRFERVKQCPFCAEDIHVAAIKCKHCGSSLVDERAVEPVNTPPPPPPPPPPSIWRSPVDGKTIFGSAFLIVAGLWITGFFDGNKATNQGGDSSSPDSISALSEQIKARIAADTAPKSVIEHSAPKARSSLATRDVAVYKTTAVDLYNAYDANEVATDRRIGKSVVEITGVIESIDKDFTDSPVLNLSVDDSFRHVLITLSKSDAGAAAELTKGQQITVKCKTIRRIIDTPIGSECALSY